ncbi:putative reverse transcriptase domain-containing protein [Tanacetum coccineum]
MCDRMFPEEIDQVEKYVGGLPDTIHGSVMATKPKTMQDAIEFATELMDKKINTWAERQADNKRKSDDTARNNQNQQPNKRQNTGRAYAAGNGDRRPYEGPRPLCSKCNYHHDGPCAPKCHKCNRFGHLSRDCRNPPNVNTGANQRVCFECGAQGHFKKDCPKLKNNNNRGNRVGNAKAQAKVYAVGNAGANPDNNVVTGTFLLNNRYASILFDTGADRSFVSTAFSSRIVITPTALDHDYNVELADGRIVGLNTIIRGCTLNFLNHPFNIDLMPVELGSFDVIIGMDWLAKYHAVIICAEKIVQFPEVFPEDLPGIPPTRQVEFRIDLVPGATPGSPVESSRRRHSQDCIPGTRYGPMNSEVMSFGLTKARPYHGPYKSISRSCAVQQSWPYPEGSKRFLRIQRCVQEGFKALWKANVVADALSRKEREPLRVRALVMTIGLDLPKQNLKAQTEARKPENI